MESKGPPDFFFRGSNEGLINCLPGGVDPKSTTLSWPIFAGWWFQIFLCSSLKLGK